MKPGVKFKYNNMIISKNFQKVKKQKFEILEANPQKLNANQANW